MAVTNAGREYHKKHGPGRDGRLGQLLLVCSCARLWGSSSCHATRALTHYSSVCVFIGVSPLGPAPLFIPSSYRRAIGHSPTHEVVGRMAPAYYIPHACAAPLRFASSPPHPASGLPPSTIYPWPRRKPPPPHPYARARSLHSPLRRPPCSRSLARALSLAPPRFSLHGLRGGTPPPCTGEQADVHRSGMREPATTGVRFPTPFMCPARRR